LKPTRPDGSAKPESEYSAEEKAGIAREIVWSQQIRHTMGQPVDKTALAKADHYATEADDVVTAESARVLTDAPLQPVPPPGTINPRALR
jgi:hypothetical protein